MGLHPKDERFFPLVIEVRTARREDGGLRVWSDELPGLILSGQPALVEPDIPVAIEVLMEELGFGTVLANRAASLPWGEARSSLVCRHRRLAPPPTNPCSSF